MQIWSAEIKELEELYSSIKGRFPELEKELEQLIETKDANVVMLYSRRCLEIIITDLCENELKRPRKTEPLKGIIDKLHHEEKVPGYIITSMHGLNDLSSYGAHPKDFDPRQVKPVLNNLATIIEWYLKYKDTTTLSQAPPEETKSESKEPVETKEGIIKSKKRLIFLRSGILLIIVIAVVALFVFNIIGVNKVEKEIEKSIAVLPFINDSPDEENTYFINGIMEEILINLQAIEDLRVISRNSVEIYRRADKPSTPDIGRALNVNYVVEGSGQKYGNVYRLRIQLIEASKDKHLWAESYEREIRETRDIFDIQSQIAQSIATELNAIITPEEKQLIEKTSTTSLNAYDFYERGKEKYTAYSMNNNNRQALEEAEDFYHKALEYDSAFAQAYVGLAMIYWNKHYWKDFFSENFLDSVIILCNIALSYDDQLSDSYTLKGICYNSTGKPEQAEQEFDKATKLNPNDWLAYRYKYYWYVQGIDLVKAIDNIQKAASINRGRELPGLLKDIANAYLAAGFMEKNKYYLDEALKMDGDSVGYFYALAGSEEVQANDLKAYDLRKKAFELDSTRHAYLALAHNYMYLGRHEESLKYYIKYIEEVKSQGGLALWDMQRIGYAYWVNGYKKESEYYFNKHLEYCFEEIKLGRYRSKQLFTYYDLAGIYAFRGEKDKAYENLRIFNQRQRFPLWLVTFIKKDPLFNSIRNEPEFQQIVRDVEAKYQTEHERVRKWLEEQGEL